MTLSLSSCLQTFVNYIRSHLFLKMTPDHFALIKDQFLFFQIQIFVDLKKTFDTVDYNILLEKFDYCGIRGVVTKLVSFLLRQQKTVCHTK